MRPTAKPIKFLWFCAGRFASRHEFDNHMRHNCARIFVDLSGTLRIFIWRIMETKIALVGIVVENTDAVTQINDLLHR